MLPRFQEGFCLEGIAAPRLVRGPAECVAVCLTDASPRALPALSGLSRLGPAWKGSEEEAGRRHAPPVTLWAPVCLSHMALAGPGPMGTGGLAKVDMQVASLVLNKLPIDLIIVCILL